MDQMMKMMEEMMKMEQGASSDPNEPINQNLVEDMLKTVMNKNFLLEPLKEMQVLFPPFLEEMKGKVSEEEYEKRQQQYQSLLNVIDAYDNNKPFEELADLMQKVFFELFLFLFFSELSLKMQNFGPPPKEIVDKMAPGTKWDANGMPEMPEDCTIL